VLSLKLDVELHHLEWRQFVWKIYWLKNKVLGLILCLLKMKRNNVFLKILLKYVLKPVPYV